MGKQAQINIKETRKELENRYAQERRIKSRTRIKSLLLIQSGEFETRQAIADYLHVHIRTMERWLNRYKSKGMDYMLEDLPKNKGSKIITREIHEGLATRVNDPHNPFLGYWDAQNWVKETYGIEVKYQRIREYLIQHFKTKVKSPRKRHVEKDVQAEKAFLKTPQGTQRP